jgi:hypothetical protein
MAKEAHAHHLNWDDDYIEGTERFANLVAAEKQEEIEHLKRENAFLRSELKHRISSDILFTEVPHLLDMTKEEADAQAEKEITWLIAHNEGAE